MKAKSLFMVLTSQNKKKYQNYAHEKMGPAHWRDIACHCVLLQTTDTRGPRGDKLVLLETDTGSSPRRRIT